MIASVFIEGAAKKHGVELTEEQQAILNAKGRVLLINARAGTGKTTTLRMIASAHPDQKILYLVFNRKTKEEANAKFPKNVEIRTVHSLAFAGDSARWKDQVGGLFHGRFLAWLNPGAAMDVEAACLCVPHADRE